MERLVREIINILSDLTIEWLAPLLGMALGGFMIAIIIAIDQSVGGMVTLITATILITPCMRRGLWWHAGVWSICLLPLTFLAFLNPVLALYWVLGLQLVTLGILLVVPGAFWPTFRQLIRGWLVSGTIITAILVSGLFIGGIINLIVLGLIFILASSLIFSQHARPWEIRRANRKMSKLIAGVGVIVLLVGLFPAVRNLPKIRLPRLPKIAMPIAIENVWAAIAAHTEKLALKAKRQLLNERAKTNSLEELEKNLQRAYKLRWKKLINRETQHTTKTPNNS